MLVYFKCRQPLDRHSLEIQIYKPKKKRKYILTPYEV